MTTPSRQRRRAPLSIRFNDAEMAELRERAGQTPLSTYIKAKTLGGTPASPNRRVPGADRALLAQVLGQLGASGLANRVKELADAAASGSLYVDPDTISQLREACRKIDAMHSALLRALFGRVSAPPPPPTRLDELFNSLNSEWRGRP